MTGVCGSGVCRCSQGLGCAPGSGFPQRRLFPTHFKRAGVRRRMHSNARACTRVHAQTCLRTHSCADTLSRACTHLCTHLHAHAHTCRHMYMPAHARAHMHTHAYACTRAQGAGGLQACAASPRLQHPPAAAKRCPAGREGWQHAGAMGSGVLDPSVSPLCPLGARKQSGMGERGSPDGSPCVTAAGGHQLVGASQPGPSCSLTFLGG